VTARVARLLKALKELYPDAHCELNFEGPFQLLVATILSAQCTDKRVNLVTPQLFRKYPDASSMARAPLEDLENLVRTTGFFKNKALSLKTMAQAVMKDHGGKVPHEMAPLVALRGVGRKTANVVRGNAFGIPGMVVDTHVGRISRRLGLTKETDPVKVEHELMKKIPEEDWTLFSHLLIFHGRRTCSARAPQCPKCALIADCPGRLPRSGKGDRRLS